MRTKEIEGKARQISSDLQIQEGPESKIISYFDELVKYWEGIEGIGQNTSNNNIVMGNGPYNHKQAKFGDDVDNLDLDLDDLGSGEFSKNDFAPPKDNFQRLGTIDKKYSPMGAQD